MKPAFRGEGNTNIKCPTNPPTQTFGRYEVLDKTYNQVQDTITLRANLTEIEHRITKSQEHKPKLILVHPRPKTTYHIFETTFSIESCLRKLNNNPHSSLVVSLNVFSPNKKKGQHTIDYLESILGRD